MEVLYDLFMDCYNEFVTEGYYKTNMDTGEDEQRLKELIETEKELTYLMMNGLLSRMPAAAKGQERIFAAERQRSMSMFIIRECGE